MSFYRNTYLKSDHWWSLRVARLAKSRGRCAICGCVNGISNDVHHIRYKNLWDVRAGDLRVLCRTCHTAYHRQLDENPELKSIFVRGGDNTGRIWVESLRALVRQHVYNRDLSRFVKGHPFAGPLLSAFTSRSPSYISAMMGLFVAYQLGVKKAGKHGFRRKRAAVISRLLSTGTEVVGVRYFDDAAWRWKKVTPGFRGLVS